MKLRSAIKNRNRQSSRRPGFIQRLQFAFRLLFAFGMQWLANRVGAENHVEYRYEYYGEEDDRITVETHSVYFEQKLIDAVIAKGEFVYDGISGATPTGAQPPGGKGPVKVVELEDVRYAGNMEFDIKLGPQTISPQVAYSSESDYESLGISLSDAIEFNDKNTTLRLGASHNFDKVLDNSPTRTYQDKDSTSLLIGVSQLLTPKTIFTADFTWGCESGYLTDPYRKATFDRFQFAYPENRPSYKSKEVFLMSLTQYVTPLNASAEASYRFYHDSYGVFSHTMTFSWHQWVGKHVMIEPMFRYYQQTAADFYAPSFPGIRPVAGSIFSADYRLSEFYSLDMGLQATVIANDHLRFNLGYHRYEMHGMDGKTASSMYPAANVFTAGIQIWF